MLVLPRGIGLVRVDFPGTPFVVVSARLTDREAGVARALACFLSERGERIVVLRETAIARATQAT